MSAPATPPLPGAATGLRVKEVVTPEGVPLRFAVALAGDRLGAFLLDGLILIAAIVLLGVTLGIAAGVGVFGGLGADLVVAILVLAVFLLRTFYFSFFELAWQGQTPGKRKLRIRVVDARGGPLSAEAILTRNLTRELELFLPLAALTAPQVLFPGAPGWAVLATLGWMLLFGFLPLFNKDRLRVGDLIAGTVVVRLPEALLLADLTTAPVAAAAAPAYAFTDPQLDVYGEYELQVLEGVLRNAGAPGHGEAVLTVAGKIRRRIGWAGPPGDEEAFLHAFYAALRGRLERRMLLGKRRASKFDRT